MLPDALRKEYDKRRSRALAEAEARRSEAFLALPRLSELERERREEAFSYGIRLTRASDKKATEKEHRAKLASIDCERARLLADNGLPIDYLEPRFTCDKCSDTGYLPGGVLCACAKNALRSLRFATSGFSNDARFELFSQSVYKDEAQKQRSVKARKLAEMYCERLALNSVPGLLIMGGTGLGKTYLMDCIGARAIERGYTAEKYTSYNFIDTWLDTIRNHTPRANVTKAELLMIDDLGAEPQIPNVTEEALFSAINERQHAGLSTVIATNLSRAEIREKYGERIFSRLFSRTEYSVIELIGKDLRL